MLSSTSSNLPCNGFRAYQQSPHLLGICRLGVHRTATSLCAATARSPGILAIRLTGIADSAASHAVSAATRQNAATVLWLARHLRLSHDLAR